MKMILGRGAAFPFPSDPESGTASSREKRSRVSGLTGYTSLSDAASLPVNS
jgi:hypothetical protein